MVESNKTEQADRKKVLGNQEFKQKNFDAAIAYYTESIDIQPHEAVYSNRAASFIAKQDFKHALEDCQAAIRLNPDFARTYKRLYKAHLALGNVEQAKEALQEAVTREPNDPTNKDDSTKMEEVIHQAQMIEKYGAGDVGMSEDQDFEKAAAYCSSILKNCPASLHFSYLKIEYLLRSYQLEEADKFSSELYNKSQNVPKVMSWRGRVCIYNGNEILGRKILTQTVQFDPDQTEAAKAMKMIKIAASKKEVASDAFKAQKLEEAIQLFDECIELDPFNLAYNATLLLNKSIAQNKLKQGEKAIQSLDLCIKMNPKYAKALVKRGEVHMAAEEYDEAVSDFAAAKALTDEFGVEGKLKQAQQNQKKAKKRDYYKDLGIEKTATEKDIKTAYRKLALKWHPDRNNETPEQAAKASKQFKIINEANAILSDPEKRKKHDMGMSGEDIESGGGAGGFDMGGMGGMGGINPEDIMKMFMGMGGAGMGGGGRGRGGGMPGGFGGMPGGFSFDMGGMGGMPGSGRGGGQQRGGGNPFGFPM